MKKLFLALSVFLFTNCSSNRTEEIEDNGVKLVHASLKTSTSSPDDPTTRLYMGGVQGGVIPGTFEGTDHIDVFDDYPLPHEFKNINGKDMQSAAFDGDWTNTPNQQYAAILPHDPKNDVILGANGNTYKFTISDMQQTDMVVNNTMVTCDRNANFLIGARSQKNFGPDAENAMYFGAVCTFLYFYSYESQIPVVSGAHNIAGRTTVVTSKKNWEGETGFSTAVSSITCEGVKTIHANGVKNVQRTDPSYDKNIYEFIVALVPGTFQPGELSIGSKTNTKKQDLLAGHLYYLGMIDPATN